MGAKQTYLIDGGAPAGTRILPGEEGCRTTRTSINIKTMQGKKRTNPSGMEMRELCLRRIRRLKKAIERGEIFSALLDRPSSVGMFCVEGIRFLTLWMKLIVSAGRSRARCPGPAERDDNQAFEGRRNDLATRRTRSKSVQCKAERYARSGCVHYGCGNGSRRVR